MLMYDIECSIHFHSFHWCVRAYCGHFEPTFACVYMSIFLKQNANNQHIRIYHTIWLVAFSHATAARPHSTQIQCTVH